MNQKHSTLVIASLFIFFSIGSVSAGAALFSQGDRPPHWDLEMSSKELSARLDQRKTLFSQNSHASERRLQKVIDLGKRNLEWLKYMNRFRETPLSLTKKGAVKGIPIDKPSAYSIPLILTRYEKALKELPSSMGKILLEKAPFTKDLPLEEKAYVKSAHELDVIYQTALRWILMEPYLDWLAKEKRKDVRGYYFLSQKDHLETYLEDYESLAPSEQKEVRSWITGLCYMDKTNSSAACAAEFESSRGRLMVMVKRYWEVGRRVYQNYFQIPFGIKNQATHRLGNRLLTSFQDPAEDTLRSFLTFNLQNEWQKDVVKLEVSFTERAPSVNVRWEPGVTPHVDRLGGSHIVMDSNASLDDWDVQWTIRHEFGHVLGFPDCYVEFYDPDQKVIINYQIDVQDLMCSRAGVYQKRMTRDLLRAYPDEMN